MAPLTDVDWPPPPFRTARLTLRQTRAEDRAGYLELLTSPEVRRYLGGSRPRAEVDQLLPAIPGRHAGIFAVALDGEFIGSVLLERRGATRPGHLRDEGNELEVSFCFLPAYWGHGYACESVEGVLDWARRAFPGEPVLLCTQSANTRALDLARRLGFRPVATHHEHDAEQWLGVRFLAAATPA